MLTKAAFAARRDQRAPASRMFFGVDPHPAESTLLLGHSRFTDHLRARI